MAFWKAHNRSHEERRGVGLAAGGGQKRRWRMYPHWIQDEADLNPRSNVPVEELEIDGQLRWVLV